MFTDVEGSSRLWEESPEPMGAAVAEHDRLLTAAVEGAGGGIVRSRGEGDSLFAVFDSAPPALRAALDSQLALASMAWPEGIRIRVRIGIHTGEGQFRQGDYYGAAVNRCARVRGLASGGQVLVTEATRQLAADQLPEGASLRDLGEHRLRDLSRPERLHQLLHPSLPAEFPPLHSADRVPNNLPTQLTSFIGRERELAELRERIGTARLVTLLGPGGSGKTRLSLQLGAEDMESWPDGVFFVNLAGLTDPALVAPAVAAAAGVPETPGIDIGSGLAGRLADKRVLLLLDNCEHLVETCAEVAESLLQRTVGPRIIATSREALRVGGESVLRVPSLSLPESDTPDGLMASDAARLFLDRAAASTGMPLQLEDANAVAIAEICRRLDGIPLAIELAAARTVSLSTPEIAARLDDRFRLLTGGSRTALPRQQTLRALIDWSHDLLAEPERILFRRLGVFAGGWTLDAAGEICAWPAAGAQLPHLDVLELLASLTAKSLAIADPGSPTRYRMLETIRTYAGEALAAAGEESEQRDRHLAWCLELCRKAEPELVGARQREWFDLLTAEHDNLRAALAWADRQNPAMMLALAAALPYFWSARGLVAEGRGWLEAGLANFKSGPEDGLVARGLLAAGTLAWTSGKVDSAEPQLRRSLGIFTRLQDPAGIAHAGAVFGHVLIVVGKPAEARQVAEAAVVAARQTGDAFLLGRALGGLADVSRYLDDDDLTLRTTEEAVEVLKRIPMEEGIGFNLLIKALALRRRDLAAARATLLEAIEHFERIDHRMGLSQAVSSLVEVAGPDPALAARLIGGLQALDEVTFAAGPIEPGIGERISARAEAALGQERFAELVAEGRKLDQASLLALARKID
jgi:predicted ATPase/class 3 adenylate cyclase